MDTHYINIGFETPAGNPIRGEFRVESSEAYPGRLDIGVFGYDSGQEFGTAHVSRERVVQLKEVLEYWLIDH